MAEGIHHYLGKHTMPPSEQEIIGTVREIVTAIMQDWGLDADVNASTRLIGDLGFTSMDIIDVIATLETRFRRKLPYESLVTFEDGSYRSEIAVEELAGFVHRNFDVTRQETMAV